MTTTATFSNGHTDTYKGTRPVTAAWAIIRNSDGATLASGHSLDADKARKTAEGNFRYVASRVLGRQPIGIDRRPTSSMAQKIFWEREAKKLGYSSWKAAHDAYLADMAHIRQAATIEVVSL